MSCKEILRSHLFSVILVLMTQNLETVIITLLRQFVFSSFGKLGDQQPTSLYLQKDLKYKRKMVDYYLTQMIKRVTSNREI